MYEHEKDTGPGMDGSLSAKAALGASPPALFSQRGCESVSVEEATNRDGDGLDLVPHLRGAPMPSPRQSALLTITFNHPLTQWALRALYAYSGHRSLTRPGDGAESGRVLDSTEWSYYTTTRKRER